MPSISMYQAAVPTFVRALTSLADVLAKAEAQAAAKKIEPRAYLEARLFPDMFTLTKQVQIASDSAKGGVARLAQQQPPAFEDNEASFAELIQRCRKTVDYLQTIKPEQMDGGEDRTVTWKTRTAEKSMQGLPYLLHHVIPNVYFHVTTAYAILRHNGVEVGKQDFLGRS
jgi:hypothetical protein